MNKQDSTSTITATSGAGETLWGSESDWVLTLRPGKLSGRPDIRSQCEFECVSSDPDIDDLSNHPDRSTIETWSKKQPDYPFRTARHLGNASEKQSLESSTGLLATIKYPTARQG
jgi:hypothetical protein